MNENKIFLSYSSKDKEFAVKLAKDLKSHQISVWADFWQINVGESIPQKIMSAIKECDYLIIILSLSSIKSKWVSKELNVAFIEELKREGVYILPLLLNECEIPQSLIDKKYADFRTDYNFGLQEILNVFGQKKNLISRYSANAGHYYPEEPEKLRNIISYYMNKSKKVNLNGDICGIIVPHLGIKGLGEISGSVYKALSGKKIDTVIIIGPAHQMISGEKAALYSGDTFKTPLGDVFIDKVFNTDLINNCNIIDYDDYAHQHEYSIEIQLPFLQYVLKQFQFVPIIINTTEYLPEITDALLKTLTGRRIENILIVVTSDLTHSINESDLKTNDSILIDSLTTMNDTFLLDFLQRVDISVCCRIGLLIMIKLLMNFGEIKYYHSKYMTTKDLKVKLNCQDDSDYIIGYGSGIIYYPFKLENMDNDYLVWG